MRLLMGLLCVCVWIGCQTTQPKAKKDSMSEAISAFGTVTEGLTNQNISQQELKNLAVSVEKDPQTKSAVESINQALQVRQTGIKYCPVDGQRYDVAVDVCSIHQVKLKLV